MINTQTQIIPESICKCSLKASYLYQQSASDQPDLTIILSTNQKQFQVQSSLVIPHSEFFQRQFRDQPQLNLIVVTKRLEPMAFEKVLKCFSGSEFIVTNMSELYYIYEVIQFLNIPCMIHDINRQIVNNINYMNFYVIFQLAFIYQQDELLEICQTLLNDKKANFRNINVAPHYLLQNKQHRKNNQLNISKPPYNFFLLSEDVFKYLIKIHNNLLNVNLNSSRSDKNYNSHFDFLHNSIDTNKKQKSSDSFRFLDYLEIFELIKMYVESKISKKQDQIHSLRELVLELIDRQTLTSDQYFKIYHNELTLLPSEIPDSLKEPENYSQIFSCTRNQKEKQDFFTYYFNPIISENYLYKKKVEELEEKNEYLQKKVFSLETILHQNKKFKTNQTNFDTLEKTIEQLQNEIKCKFENRVGLLEDQLVQLRTEILLKDKQKDLCESPLSQLQNQDQQSNKKKDAWESTENDSQLDENQKIEQNQTLNQFNSTNQLKFPSTPESMTSIQSPVKQQSLLNELIKKHVHKLTQPDIFESIQFAQQYEGNCLDFSVIKYCKKPLLILIQFAKQIIGVYMSISKGNHLIFESETLELEKCEIQSNVIKCDEILTVQSKTINGCIFANEQKIFQVCLYEIKVSQSMDI